MHVGKQIRFDPVFCKHASRLLRKQSGISARIVRDRHAARHRFRAERNDVFRQSLRRPHDGANVHHVFSATDQSAHSRGAEFEFPAETVLFLLFVRCNRGKLRALLFTQTFVAQPRLVFLLIVHDPSCLKNRACARIIYSRWSSGLSPGPSIVCSETKYFLPVA